MIDQLTIVILNYNTLDLLQRCLGNLEQLGVPNSQIIVVDNHSTDGSPAWLKEKESEGVTALLLQNNLGFSAGNNAGIAVSTTPFVLLLNSDAFPQTTSIEQLLQLMRKYPDAGVVGPQLLFGDGRWQRSTGMVHSPRSAMLDAFGLPAISHMAKSVLWPVTGKWWRVRDVASVSGASMLLRKSMLDKIGLLDEDFFFYSEDVEICVRARRNGYRVLYCPGARVTHLAGASSRKKDRSRSATMLRTARKLFVLKEYGKAGLEKYAAWRRRGLWMRYALCRPFAFVSPKMRERCREYLVQMQEYRLA